MTFALTLVPVRGRGESHRLSQGYLIELSLSMDNVFVIAVIFRYFRVPSLYQHRAFFSGAFLALIMRGLMIWLGAELIHSYEWVLYIFGLFLVLTGLKMLTTDDTEEVRPDAQSVLRRVRRFFPFTTEYDGWRFFLPATTVTPP